MADKKKPNDPRFFGEECRSTARQMRDSVVDPMSFSTRFRLNESATVRLDTKGGMPRITVDSVSAGKSALAPRGLVAYPFSPADSENRTWVKPAVIFWEGDAWRVSSKNPQQTAAEVSAVPGYAEVTPHYWTDVAGNTAIRSDDKLWYGFGGSVSGYARLVRRRVPDALFSATYTVPFITGQTAYAVGVLGDVALVVKPNGDEVYRLSDFRAYNGELKPYDIALPPSVTTNGQAVLLNRAFAHGWADRTFGVADVDTSKHYLFAVLSMLSGAVQVYYTDLPTFGYYDCANASSRVADNQVSGDLAIEGCFFYFDSSNGGGSIPGAFACRPTYSDGSVADAYNPAYYIPPHNEFYAGDLTDFGPVGYDWRTHEGRHDSLTLAVSPATQIGNVADRASVVPVFVTTTASLSFDVRADGYSYRCSPAIPDTSLFPGYNLAWYRGDTHREGNIRKVQRTDNDAITVTVNVGTNLNIFEHAGSSASSGTAKTEQTISTFIFASGAAFWVQGGEGGLDTPRWFQNNDIRACTPPLTNPYPGDPIGTEYQARPTVAASVDFYNPKYSNTWRDTSTFSPYSGSASFTATSRTILAADVELQFFAWVECTVAAGCAFSSPSASWFVSKTDPSLTVDHRVDYRVVIRFRGVDHVKDLFSHTANKPGPWDIQQIEDWLNWPWTNTIPGTMNVIGPPRVYPGVSAHAQADLAFLHQGVNPDLAGTTEYGEPQVIYAKRFRIKDVGADWMLSYYLVSEGERGAETSVSYYYCPELKPKVEQAFYQIEFDHTGFRLWIDDIPPTTGLAPAASAQRGSCCYRV